MLKLHEKSGDDTVALMADIGRRARAAARPLAIATAAAKNAALLAMADAIISREQDILDANAIDVSNGHESGLSASLMDRLKLNPARIRAMADGIREIARGLVAYDAADAVRIAGLKTAEIETVLGYEARSAMIHRDDLVVSHAGSDIDGG